MSATTLPLLIAFAVGYVLGSIPFGLLITKAAGLGDIRRVGSGNIGATNVLRTGAKGLAAATLLLDTLKGTAAALLVPFLAPGYPPIFDVCGPACISANATFEFAGYAAGLGAFLGHLYPVWLGFKGGKGVATYIGVLLGLLWPAALVFCLIWLVVAVLSRYSSLAALVASVVTPLVAWAFSALHLAVLLVPMTLLLLYKHSSNISRLVRGEEPKIGAQS